MVLLLLLFLARLEPAEREARWTYSQDGRRGPRRSDFAGQTASLGCGPCLVFTSTVPSLSQLQGRETRTCRGCPSIPPEHSGPTFFQWVLDLCCCLSGRSLTKCPPRQSAPDPGAGNNLAFGIPKSTLKVPSSSCRDSLIILCWLNVAPSMWPFARF